MLISVIGAQGCGKSTLLNELYCSGVAVDNFKVSRAVQKELGISSLGEVTSDFNSMKQFQEMILEQKYENDRKLKKESPVLVERSFFDLIAYTELWCSRLGLTSNDSNYWLPNYKQVCLEYQKIYDGIILIENSDEIVFERDKNRAGEDSRDQIYSRLRELCEMSGILFTVIKEANLEKRVSQSLAYIKHVCK